MKLLAESSGSRKSKVKTKKAVSDDEEDDLQDILSARAKRQKRQAAAAALHEVSISDRSTDSSAASVLDDKSRAEDSSITSMETDLSTVNGPSLPTTTDSMMVIDEPRDDKATQEPVITAPSNTDGPATDGDQPVAPPSAVAPTETETQEDLAIGDPVVPPGIVPRTETGNEEDPVVNPVAAAASAETEDRGALSELSSVEDEPTMPRRSGRGAGKQIGTGKGKRGNAKGITKGKGKGKRT